MTDLQIENLFIFYFLYNGCDRSKKSIAIYIQT